MRIVYPPQLDERKDDPLVKSVIQLYELINLMGLDESNIASKSLKGQQILLNNNDKLQARNSSGVATNLLYLDTTNYLALSQLARQDITTNSTQTDVSPQWGWSYIQGDGTADLTKTVTFPQAFSAAPVVIVQMLGQKDTSAPTVIGDIVDGLSMTVNRCFARSITTTNFVMKMNFSAAIASTRYMGFVWQALGSI